MRDPSVTLANLFGGVKHIWSIVEFGVVVQYGAAVAASPCQMAV
jgi:hypothetical protein